MPITISENGELLQSSPPLKGIRGEAGEAVQEFISRKPGFLIEHGTVLFLCILLAIVAACWFIQYSDVITTSAKLKSINAPKAVVNKMQGKLVKLLVKENDSVKENEVIGYMESTANPVEVLKLEAVIDTVNVFIQSNKEEMLPGCISGLQFKNLGELQQPYQTFIQAYIAYKDYISNGFYERKRNMLSNSLNDLVRLHANLSDQKYIQQQDETLAVKTYEMNEKLLNEKVISLKEFRDEKSKMLNKSLSVPQVNAAIISNETQQNEKRKEMLELDNQAAQQQAVFMQALNTLKNEVADWKKHYMLIAPVKGKVSFTSFIQEKEELTANQTICYINPANTASYAEIFIPQSNFGKARIGEKVLLKFQAYPYEQYGSIEGVLSFVSPVATDSGYAAKVDLPKGLTTNFGKKILYRDGLLSTADIVTEDMRLLQRFYYDVYKQVKK